MQQNQPHEPPTQTHPQLEHVGFWPRLGAKIIDKILLTLITTPILLTLYDTQDFQHLPTPFQDPNNLLKDWLTLCLPIQALDPTHYIIIHILPACAILLFWFHAQATPGKMTIRAKIVDANTGNPPTTQQYIIRYIGYTISLLPLGLGHIWIALDPKKQAWHDKLANTLIIRPKTQNHTPVQFNN